MMVSQYQQQPTSTLLPLPATLLQPPSVVRNHPLNQNVSHDVNVTKIVICLYRIYSNDSTFLLLIAESALKSFLSGGVGGICVVLVGHPFDLVKVCYVAFFLIRIVS
jgi:hypothetical protein